MSYFDEYFERRKEQEKIVSSLEYIQWIESELNKKDSIDSEYCFYMEGTETDKKFGPLLSAFHSYLQELAEKQDLYSREANCPFPEYSTDFYYNRNYYCITTIMGQGTSVFVEKSSEIPENFVILGDFEFDHNNKLMQYIIVNDNNVTSKELSLLVAKASVECGAKESLHTKYHIWYKYQSMKILKSSSEKLRKFAENGYYAVKDSETNEILAISLGVKHKKELDKITSGLTEL